ncbi:uncharacterized protein [Ptychodera flava]|uniref:uncharacterized protein n=1 Tax=Ptychodera flava TaxID=63121 RepID=UPI003969F623
MSIVKDDNMCEGGDVEPVEPTEALQSLNLRPERAEAAEAEAQPESDRCPEPLESPSYHKGLAYPNGKAECIDYKSGICRGPEKCGPKHHPHVIFPSANWERQHMQRLRFECYSFNITQFVPDRRQRLNINHIISEWLSSDELIRVLGRDKKLGESPGLAAAALCAQDKIPYVLSHVIPSKLQIEEDGFLQLLTSYARQYDMEIDDTRTLFKGAVNKLRNANVQAESGCVNHRTTLATWVDACDHYANGKLTEQCLDDLLLAIIRSASQETDCIVISRIGESATRSITVCGHVINIESNIEVTGLNTDGILKMIFSSKIRSLSRPMDLKKLKLPQIASESLAVAECSPFVGPIYKKTSLRAARARCS